MFTLKSKPKDEVDPYLLREPPPRNAKPRQDARKLPELDNETPERMPWLWIGLMAGSIVALMALSMQHKYLLGQVIVPIIGFFGLHGLWRGGLRKIIVLPVSAGMMYLVASNPAFADPLIRSMAGTSSTIGNAIACAAAVFFALLIAQSIAKAIRKAVVAQRPLLHATDRTFGTLIGLAEGTFIALVICWTTVLIEPQARTVTQNPNLRPGTVPHKFTTGVVRFVQDLDDSPMGPFIRANNIVERFPAVQAGLERLSSPEGFSLGAIDPELERQAREWLNSNSTSEGGLADLIKQYREGNMGRDGAYDNLPQPAEEPRRHR